MARFEWWQAKYEPVGSIINDGTVPPGTRIVYITKSGVADGWDVIAETPDHKPAYHPFPEDDEPTSSPSGGDEGTIRKEERANG